MQSLTVHRLAPAVILKIGLRRNLTAIVQKELFFLDHPDNALDDQSDRNEDDHDHTAEHEFYGISVIEAVRAGCHPVLPARLSYPELFPAEYLYEDGELFGRLKVLLENPGKLDRSRAQTFTECFSWPALKGKYLEWFGGTSQNTG